jgi:alkylation response protein AidB-like acyl-CoA dehydrogenase
VDVDLTDQQIAVRKAAREFAEAELAPSARANDRAARCDPALIRRMGDAGWLGVPLPEAYGGRELDHVCYALVTEEVGRVDSSLRTAISITCSLVAKTILAWGTDEQKDRWLPGLASGAVLGCFGLTEPQSGSDAAGLATAASRAPGGGWVLRGRKMWIGNGGVADLALIIAQTDPSLHHDGMAAFLVPTDTPGFRAEEIEGKLGLRAASTARLFLDGVKVGPDALLGEVGQGFKVAMSALDNGRFSVAAGCVGIMQASLDAALDYAGKRDAFDKPIASFQLVQELLADVAVETDAARLLVLRAARLKDRGLPSTVETSMAKLFASEAAVRAANAAIQVHGGNGYFDEYPVERYLRDARVATLYEGTTQIQKLIIGKHLTGIDAISR